MPASRRLHDPAHAAEVLFLAVVMRAGTLAVVDARGAAGGAGHDVIALPDRSIAERASTAQIAPAQETGQGRREGLRPRFDRYQLTAGRMGVQASQHGADRRPIGAVAVLLRGLGGAQRGAQLLPDRLGGYRTVALDLRDLTLIRREQGAVGDDQADVEGARVHLFITAEDGVDQDIGHDRLVTAPVSAGTQPLRLEGEALMGLGGVDPRKSCRQDRKSVVEGKSLPYVANHLR